MKIILNLLRFLITFILTICIIILVLTSIASSTVLNKGFILQQLENTNYYANTYTAVNEDFKNYIYQSGLDEQVLDGIVSLEQVRNDTKTIINNIYDGTDVAVDTTQIATNLNNNINASLEEEMTETQRRAIETFVTKITEQYTETISHTSYEDTINDYFSKITKAVNLLIRVSAIGAGVSAILLLLLSVKHLTKGICLIASAVTASGLFNILVNVIVNANVKIQNITILNDAISITLREILTSIMNTINKYGIIMLVVGIVIIIVCSIITNRKKDKETQ